MANKKSVIRATLFFKIAVIFGWNMFKSSLRYFHHQHIRYLFVSSCKEFKRLHEV